MSAWIAKLNGEAAEIKAAASEGEGVKIPSFAGVAYSGGIVSRKTLSVPLDADYIIDLSAFSTGKNVKANLDHKSTQRVGHLAEASNDGKQVSVSGLLSAETPYRDEVAKSAANGYGWEVSIEAGLGAKRKIPSGKSETINGRLVNGPLYVFKGVLTGLGFVNNGADAGNDVMIAASAEVKTTTLRELREAAH